MILQNGRIRIEVDPHTGAVKRVEDTVRKMVHLQSRPGVCEAGRLFRIVAPSEAWRTRYADSHAQPPPEIRERNRGITIRFADLRLQGGESSGISAEAKIDLSNAADELLFTLHIENRGTSEVNEVLFPWLGGWIGQGGPGRDRILAGAAAFVDPHRHAVLSTPPYARERYRTQFSYPVNLFVPWMDISGPAGGMSYINYMPEALNGYLSLENLAGRSGAVCLAFGWAHTIVVRPGQNWTSPPLGLAVHGGDWHQTADRYRQWTESHLRKPLTSRSARTTIGFQNVFFRSFDGMPMRDYAQIPAVAAAGRRSGVDHLSIWDYLPLGNYDPHPELDLLDYTEAEREALRRGLMQAKTEGSNVSALINFRHVNTASKRFKNHAETEVKRNYDGSAQHENWAGSNCHGMTRPTFLGPECRIYSPFSTVYRERVLRLTRDYLSLGFTSMFYDQPFELHPDYSRVDQGCCPDTTQREVISLIAAVRELLHQNDPNAIMIGEECDVFASQWIDMWMSWGLASANAEPIMAAARYAIPSTMLCWTLDNEIEGATLAFALGMYLCLCIRGNEATLADEDDLAEHVAALAKLRQATAERTVLARFNDRVGLIVEAEKGFYAYSYDSPAGPGVIVAAPGAKARGKVAIDRRAFTAPGTPGAGVVYRMDGTQERVGGDTCRFFLEKNEVAVWVA